MTSRIGLGITDRHPEVSRIGAPLATLLMVLTVFGPISMDLYLPVLPALTRELSASTSPAQLTLTACLIGLAGGQIIAGPLSDRFGRRRPLLIGIAAYIAASVLCAISPSILILMAARLVQGLAGAVGIVIAQAAGRDVYAGAALIRYYGRLTVLGGLAAIVGPVLGGQLARITHWRGTFVFLAAIGALLLLAVQLIFGETLPADRRTSGGLRQTGRHLRRLLSDPALRRRGPRRRPHLRRGVRLPVRSDVHPAGRLRLESAAVFDRVRHQLRRIHAVRLRRRPRGRAVVPARSAPGRCRAQRRRRHRTPRHRTLEPAAARRPDIAVRTRLGCGVRLSGHDVPGVGRPPRAGRHGFLDPRLCPVRPRRHRGSARRHRGSSRRPPAGHRDRGLPGARRRRDGGPAGRLRTAAMPRFRRA